MAGARPEMWILGSSLFGAQLAAYLGLPYSFASHFAPAALEAAIREDLEHHNASPRPFRWTADADLILDRVKKVIERTSDSGH